MKKILLSLMLIGAFIFGKAQVVFNEIWYNPGTSGGNDEYIELYNPGGNETMGCYTILSHYNNGTDSGFVVINFPDNINLLSGHYSVLGADNLITHQAVPYNLDGEDFNWADGVNLAANNGYIKDFRAIGTTYATPTVPSNLNDVLRDLGNNVQPANFITLLYRNGILVNALAVGVGTKLEVPAKFKNMPPLIVPSDGDSCAQFTATFSTLTNNQFEYMGSGIGANNGVHRTADGKCGTWVKSASSSDDTPGSTNGPSSPISGAITLGGAFESSCTAIDGKRTVNYFVVNASTLPEAYPMVLLLYFDNGSILGSFDAGDTFLEQQNLTTAPAPGAPNTVFTRQLPGANKDAFVIARSTAGCFESIYNIDNSCIPLPVKFKSFNASRQNTSTVDVSWITASEENSKGFNIQRNVGGVWTTVAYVPSKSVNGTSSSDLSYSFTDANSEKGVTQYRVQQVDLDGKFSYTDIRAIRGEGTVGKVIVYPNPSVDGKVNVVFEDNSSIRDIQVNDMQGKVIRTFKGITNNILVIDRLTSGFYTIKITNRNTAASSVEKVVVK